MRFSMFPSCRTLSPATQLEIPCTACPSLSRRIPLEALGFPGSCSDPDGGVFTPSNLVSCITDAVQSQVDIAVMVEYPDLQTLSDAGAHCQSTIGGEGRLFMSRKERARNRCLNRQLRNPSSVDCRAEVPPGTGDASTDLEIMDAANRLADKLQHRGYVFRWTVRAVLRPERDVPGLGDG